VADKLFLRTTAFLQQLFLFANNRVLFFRVLFFYVPIQLADWQRGPGGEGYASILRTSDCAAPVQPGNDFEMSMRASYM
jgi:hypothetical protein